MGSITCPGRAFATVHVAADDFHLTGSYEATGDVLYLSAAGDEKSAPVQQTLGAEGWELATVFLDVNLHPEKDGHVIVFKRRVG